MRQVHPRTRAAPSRRTDRGTISFDGIAVRELAGEDLRRLRRRMQMIFQDPMASLDPRQSVESILTEPLAAHGTTSKRLSGAPGSASCSKSWGFRGARPAATRTSSPAASGSASALPVRLRSILELIVADEPVSALDVSIQAQVVNPLEDLQAELDPPISLRTIWRWYATSAKPSA